jgi:DNA-binding transcriptional MerR regulator
MFEKRRNFLLLGDAFDLQFAKFHCEAKKFKQNFDAKSRTIKDEQISARVLNHWIKSGLIEDERPEGKGWHKFSHSDLIWIKLMTKLRSFGVSIGDLKNVKRHLEMGSKSESKRPLLEFYIAYTHFEKKPAYVLVFTEGEALIGSQYEIDSAMQYGSIKDDFISIDINRLLGKKGVEIDYLDYGKSEIEQALSWGLHDPQIKKITIESKEAKYVVKSSQLMENRDMAIAAKRLHEFCTFEETVHNGKSKFELTTSTMTRK